MTTRIADVLPRFPSPAAPRPVPAPPVSTPILSKESGLAPFETLFHDFSLKAVCKYNYWTEDEERNDIEFMGDRSLDELPRYVRLTWNVAPEIKDENSFGKGQLQGNSRDTAIARPGVNVNGISFAPGALTLDESTIRSTANGYIAAGVVEAVVETSTPVTGNLAQANLVDEDAYLSKSWLWGIPFSEFNSVLWNMKSSVYGVQKSLYDQRVSEGGTASVGFIDGKYGVKSPPEPGGVIQVKSSLMEFSANVANSDRSASTSRIAEILKSFVTSSSMSTKEYIRSKFVNTSLTGIVDEARIASINTPEQAESITAIAPFLSNLVVYAEVGVQDKNRQVNIPSFPGPADLAPLEYVGYVIEKYSFENGSFSLQERIPVSGREKSELVDSRVKYGVTYRYRIKSVLRWSRPRGTGVLGGTPQEVNTLSLAPNEISYFTSEWSPEWAKVQVIDMDPPNPPDELQVLPISGGPNGPEVWVSMRIPYNPQRDITKMALLRKIEGKTDWTTVAEFNLSDSEFRPRYVDRDVTFYQNEKNRYVYAGVCYTIHGEVSVLSEQLAARLNENSSKTGEFPVEFISCAGVEKSIGGGLFATYPERRIHSELIVEAQDAITAAGQERLGQGVMANNHYILRIESLDNGQVVEVPVNISYIDQPR